MRVGIFDGTDLLAGDSFGLKPLFLAKDGKTLLLRFPQTLSAGGRIEAEPDPAGHVQIR